LYCNFRRDKDETKAKNVTSRIQAMTLVAPSQSR
jgi:hypothetical protein